MASGEHVDEREMHLLSQDRRHLLREIADHRHPALLAGAVRHEQQTHCAYAKYSSTASR